MRNQHKVIAGIGTLAALQASLRQHPPQRFRTQNSLSDGQGVPCGSTAATRGSRRLQEVSDANLSNELFNDGPWSLRMARSGRGQRWLPLFHNRSGNNGDLLQFPKLRRRRCLPVLADGAKDNFGDALKNKVSPFIISNEGVCTNVDQRQRMSRPVKLPAALEASWPGLPQSLPGSLRRAGSGQRPELGRSATAGWSRPGPVSMTPPTGCTSTDSRVNDRCRPVQPAARCH